MIIYCLIIILLLLFYYLNNNINKIEYFSSINVQYLNKNELLNVLINNNDNYYNRFDKYDLIARGVNSIEEYTTNNIKNSTIDLTIQQKNKLEKSIEFANKKLKEINIYGFDGNKCANIPWKIGGIKGKQYENGLPHTRDDIIILPDFKINNKNIEDLARLLVHEKVHIYQKIYKDDIDKYLENNNIKLLKKRNENDMIRSNPDLDNYIYYDDKLVYLAKYNSTNPKSIEDVTYNYNGTQKSEHPFEKMAIEIEEMI